MEIKTNDLAGRIGKLKIKGKTVETPTILPVVNPNKVDITPSEMKSNFGVDGIITNSYIFWKNEELRNTVLSKGVHNYLDFDGIVMTDSGAFQLMQYGKISVTNKEILEFQRDIGVDIGVPLDVPGLGDRKQMEDNLEITLERIKEARHLISDDDFLLAGPVQGGVFQDLREKSAKELVSLGFNYFAVGSVVPSLNRYDFDVAFDSLVTTRRVIPWDKPVHFFGAGHPMMFAFSVALGTDIFDSAAYALFADKGKYLTPDGTRDIDTMKETTCSCPVCVNHSIEEIKKDKSLLVRHNLYVTMEEMRNVREAIRQGTLWELLEKRARSHPQMLKAFRNFVKYTNYLEEKDTVSKKRFFFLSNESLMRPEVVRHTQKVKSGTLKSKRFVDLFPFDNVPVEVVGMYPFGQREGPLREKKPDVKVSDEEIVKGIFGYIYGYYDIIPENIVIKRSKNTHRIRDVYLNDKLLFVLRASDYIPILHNIAYEMVKRDKWKVIVKNGTEDYIREGRSLFAKFVDNADKDIRPGMSILIADQNNELLATGIAKMSGKDMLHSNDGIAVDTKKLRSS